MSHREQIEIEIEFSGVEYNSSYEQKLQTVISTAAAGENMQILGITVILADDSLLRRLNHDYLEIDEPTDVLSFDLRDNIEDPVEGDIYISLDRAKAQAGDGNLHSELLRLAVHGFLHLCGQDHDDDVSLQGMIACGEKYVTEVLHREVIGS